MANRNKNLEKKIKSMDKTLSNKEAMDINYGLQSLFKASRNILKEVQISYKKFLVKGKYRLGKSAYMSDEVKVGENFTGVRNGIAVDVTERKPNEDKF